MNKKILFALFVFVLFSSAVFADLTPQQTRAKERASLVKESHNYKIKSSMYGASAAAVEIMGNMIGPIGVAATAPVVAEMRTEETEAMAQSEGYGSRADAYRQRILNRPVVYSFYDYLNAYDDYSGLNVYGALYLGEEKLAKRREAAADLFCDKTLILGGKACWKSRMCDSYYYSHEPPVGQNILVVQPMVGGYEPAVSIQGETSLPILYQEGGSSKTKFVYKITYFISNPLDRNLNYHIQLRGDDDSFESPVMVISRSDGNQIFRVDRSNINPLFTESNKDYHTVCLTFSPRMPTIRGGSASELCTPIIQYDGAATMPYEILDANLTQGTAGETSEPQSVDSPLDGA